MLVTLLLLGAFSVEGREPSIQELHEQVLRFAGYDHHEVSRWAGRARWSAVLPRLQAGFDRDIHDDVSLTTNDSVSVSGGTVLVGPAKNSFDQDIKQTTGFDVRAVWYLNELIFNRDTLEANSEQRRWYQDRMRLLGEVTHHYYERVSLLERLRKCGVSSPERRPLDLSREQIEATLDAMSGGWFKQELAR